MDWLKLDAGIHGNEKIWRAASDAGLSVPTFVGHYTGLLCHLARQESPDGHIESVPDQLMEHAMMWVGHPGFLARVVREHFENNDGCLVGWEKRNGSAMKEAQADRERKRVVRLEERRKREAAKDAPPDNLPDAPPDNLPHERTDVRTDVPVTTTTPLFSRQPKKASVAGGWPATVAACWVREVGVIREGRVGKDLQPFVRLYPTPELGEAAALAAIPNYVATCRRRDERPRWLDFMTNIRGHLPTHLLPTERAA